VTVYVAQIDTRYETIAVGTTEDKARRLAGRHALRWLKANGVTQFRTVNQVLEYFGCNVTECKVDGSATVC
jgi:hypothetical protein